MKLSAEWITGFVDGEGCFHVAVNAHKEMTVGFQVLPEFTVVQHERDVQLLHAFKDFFKCGVVRVNHGDRMAYRVRGLKDLQNTIVPFFTKHSLKSHKNIAFKKFKSVILMMERGEHLTVDGIERIRLLTHQMNRNQTR